MSRLMAALATLIAVCLVAPGASASATAADPYAPKIPTEVKIKVKAKHKVGEDIKITYEVVANSESDEPIRGKLDVDIRGAGGGGQSVLTAAAISQSYDYNDTPITQDIGSQPIGDYAVSASFTPEEGSAYLPSDNTGVFTVVGAVPPESETDDGILPNAGGPALWWLLLALLLVAGGAGSVYYSRRSA